MHDARASPRSANLAAVHGWTVVLTRCLAYVMVPDTEDGKFIVKGQIFCFSLVYAGRSLGICCFEREFLQKNKTWFMLSGRFSCLRMSSFWSLTLCGSILERWVEPGEFGSPRKDHQKIMVFTKSTIF